MDRSECKARVDEIAQQKADLGTIENFDQGAWEAAEWNKLIAQGRFDEIDYAALRKEYLAAVAEDEKQLRAERRRQIVRTVFGQVLQYLHAEHSRCQNLLQTTLMAPVLRESIKNMELEVEKRRGYGLAQVVFGQIPSENNPITTSDRGRTPAHKQATARAEQALEVLKSLKLTPDDQLQAAVTKVLEDLHQADMAALWEAPVSPPPAPSPDKKRAARLADAFGDRVIAELLVD